MALGRPFARVRPQCLFAGTGATMASEVKPIVGRAAEIAYLEQCLETALTGERQVVFVSGEPGIGKTTIIDAFRQRLEAGG